jgi:uncharacterized membrane protein YeaQ/YmgE (transglycosylase-associated protein family)
MMDLFLISGGGCCILSLMVATIGAAIVFMLWSSQIVDSLREKVFDIPPRGR